MKKLMTKGAILTMLFFGLLVVATAPDANAQDRCRNRGRYVTSNYDNYYDSYDRRDDRFSRDFDRRSDRFYRDRYYDNDEDTTGRALKRTGIGAGIGTLGGALIGGKKGAIIGAAIGAAGGYAYHRKKVNDQRDRYRY